jgi:glycosyltransferase involved in cell wall biosynthesis
VILESLSCGTPVISMDLNGIPEMVNEHNGILVPASDPHRLADAIMTMFSAHKRYDRNAIAADAFSRYSVEVIASQILEVYDEVIRKPHGE